LIAVYRNLNKAKQDKTKYIWSLADINSARTRGKVFGYSDPDQVIQLTNAYAVIQPGTLKRIQDKQTREVGAWIVGDRSDAASTPTNARRITLNPLVGDTDFIYADTKQVVNFREVETVTFSRTGCYVS